MQVDNRNNYNNEGKENNEFITRSVFQADKINGIKTFTRE